MVAILDFGRLGQLIAVQNGPVTTAEIFHIELAIFDDEGTVLATDGITLRAQIAPCRATNDELLAVDTKQLAAARTFGNFELSLHAESHPPIRAPIIVPRQAGPAP